MLKYIIYVTALIIFSFVVYLAGRAFNMGLKAKNNFKEKNKKKKV